jgi:hypothetical protein
MTPVDSMELVDTPNTVRREQGAVHLDTPHTSSDGTSLERTSSKRTSAKRTESKSTGPETADAPRKPKKRAKRVASKASRAKSEAAAEQAPVAKVTAGKSSGKTKTSTRKSKHAEAPEADVARAAKKSEPLDRDALLELEPIRKLVEVGEEKGTVDRFDLRTAFEDAQLGKADLDGVLSVLRENGSDRFGRERRRERQEDPATNEKA